MNEKIIIKNWTDEPLENLLGYIARSMKEKKLYYNSNEYLILNFEKITVIYGKNKKSDVWIIQKKL